MRFDFTCTCSSPAPLFFGMAHIVAAVVNAVLRSLRLISSSLSVDGGWNEESVARLDRVHPVDLELRPFTYDFIAQFIAS